MAPSTTPKFIYYKDSLLYKPSSSSPLLLSPLNWFFQLRWQSYAWQSWSFAHRVNHRSFYHLYAPFAVPDYKISWHPPLVRPTCNQYDLPHTRSLKRKMKRIHAADEPPPSKRFKVSTAAVGPSATVSASLGSAETVPQQSLPTP